MSHRSTILALLLATASFISMPASAQSMKPGLWEINKQVHSSDGLIEKSIAKTQQQMSSMPPEQRKMMLDMMARQGFDITPTGMSMKLCLTKEMVERNEVPTHSQPHEGNCTHNRSPIVGNTMKISYTCTPPPSSGDGQVTFASNEAYSMKMSMKLEGGTKGKPYQTNMEASAKWLGADCGSIKPTVPPAAKKQ